MKDKERLSHTSLQPKIQVDDLMIQLMTNKNSIDININIPSSYL